MATQTFFKIARFYNCITIQSHTQSNTVASPNIFFFVLSHHNDATKPTINYFLPVIVDCCYYPLEVNHWLTSTFTNGILQNKAYSALQAIFARYCRDIKGHRCASRKIKVLLRPPELNSIDKLSSRHHLPCSVVRYEKLYVVCQYRPVFFLLSSNNIFNFHCFSLITLLQQARSDMKRSKRGHIAASNTIYPRVRSVHCQCRLWGEESEVGNGASAPPPPISQILQFWALMY
jgi:hypothetical protein